VIPHSVTFNFDVRRQDDDAVDHYPGRLLELCQERSAPVMSDPVIPAAATRRSAPAGPAG
jgi:hypothetical protein